MTDLWDPVTVGEMALAHRLVMAPMTRDRSRPDGAPSDLNVEYYGQRAPNGLIITEGTQPSPDGQGYLLTPGIHDAAQVAGWRRVTDAVHAAGGRIVIQLMHAGRIAHPANTPHGRTPVAPSAVTPEMEMVTASGSLPIPEPRALSADEVAATIADYAHAARCAIEAGADGVEVHAANGYLVHQFLSSNANRREDRYGGSVENRIRFAVEVTRAVADAIGPGRVGVQISPGNPFNDIVEDDVEELYPRLVAELATITPAYLNLVHGGDDALWDAIRAAWPTALLVNRAGAEVDRRAQDVSDGRADLVSVGRLALANPDFVERVRRTGPFNDPDPDTFYGGGAAGYTDYPTLDDMP